MSAEQIPILMYHSIDDSCSSRFRRFAVSPRSFKAHVRYLSDSGYQTLTVSELIEAMDGRAVMPPKPVVLTFDDGFADFYEAALPILTEFGQTVTLYVVSGAVGGSSAWLSGIGEGTRRMVSWAQLDEIRRSGIEIGAHTATHAALDLLSLEEARQEIAVSKRDLEDRLGVDRFELRVSLRLSERRRSTYRAEGRLFFRLRRTLRDEFDRGRPICPLATHCTRLLGSRRVRRRIARPAASNSKPLRADEIPRVERCAPISSELLSMSSRSVFDCNLRLHAGSLGRYRRCDCIGAGSNIAASGNHRCGRPQSRAAGSSDQDVHGHPSSWTINSHVVCPARETPAFRWHAENRSVSRRRCDCGPGLAFTR